VRLSLQPRIPDQPDAFDTNAGTGNFLQVLLSRMKRKNQNSHPFFSNM